MTEIEKSCSLCYMLRRTVDNNVFVCLIEMELQTRHELHRELSQTSSEEGNL